MKKKNVIKSNECYVANGNNQRSLSFNGTGDYLSLPDKKDWKFGSGNFTICGFIYINKKGKLIIKDCNCKCGKKCKGLKIKRK